MRYFFLALACAFRPDGKQIAVSTVDAQILFFHPETGQQTASIEGKHDLGYARKETDKVTGKKLTFGRFDKAKKKSRLNLNYFCYFF